MKEEKMPGWMFSPKSFVSLLGGEYELMRRAGTNVLAKFYVTSVLIIGILALTWISIRYAIDLLFHSMFVEISLAVFFALLFTCIYVFLINTFTKERRRGRNRFVNVSNLVRLGFVVFMAFLIAQPINIMLFESSLDQEVAIYKTRLVADIRHMETTLDAVQNDAEIAIDRNSFFLYRINRVNKQHRIVCLIDLVIIIFFLTPGFLIYAISADDQYFRMKKKQEEALIRAGYEEFSNHYFRITGLKADLYPRYEDPPFNIIRKQPLIPADMNAFRGKYLKHSKADGL